LSDVSRLGTAGPGEGIVGGATEGADVESLFPMVAESIVPDVPLDADFLSVGVAQGVVIVCSPGGLSVTEFWGRFVVNVKCKEVSSFSTEDTAGKGRDLAAAFWKGT
jgi:hypothetical protein